MEAEINLELNPVRAQERQRGLLDYLSLMARGFMMGSADVVPGVSGGTIALITGIYEELIDSIHQLARPEFIQAVLKLRVRQALAMSNWRFLASVGTGILLAIFTVAKLLEWLLQEHPVLLWSFFFGLVLASVLIIASHLKNWSLPLAAALVLSAVGSFFLVGMVPVQTPNEWWFLVLSGALAICAMILPGISGAFVLVLLGKYQFVLSAVNDRDLLTIGLVGAGAAVGLVTFAQVLHWLFKRYHDLTIATLIGLMIGSLRKLWPWKITTDWMLDSHGQQMPIAEQNVLPELFIDASFNLEVVFALILAVTAFLLVGFVEQRARK